MSRIVAALNMTMDGIVDHTEGVPDEEVHQHYTELMGQGSAILYGRTTYQLMEFWRTFLEHPSDEPSMNDFATTIDRIPKIVFSRTLTHVDWASATLAERDLAGTVAELKQRPGNDVFIGSRSLINQLMNLGLIDEYQICIQPVVAGKGSPLFNGVNDRALLKLVRTKTFKGGAVTLYYEPADQ